jgi:hypothetical protein
MYYMMIYTQDKQTKPKLKPRAVREQYDQWLKSHQNAKPIKAVKTDWLKDYSKSLSVPVGRITKHAPSLDTGPGNAALAAPKVYTGTKVLGIATMHKSNAVPVFNSEEAVEISKMRR